MSNNPAIVLLQQLKTVDTLVLKGPSEIGTVREAIRMAVRDAGFEITFDPQSDSGLMAYLASACPEGAEGILGGAFFGSLLGLAFDSPGLGAALGTRLGLTSRTIKGPGRGGGSWRIRAVHDENGAPVITINTVHAS